MKFKIKVKISTQPSSAFVEFGLLRCAEFVIFLSTMLLLIQPSNGGSLKIPASHQQHQNSGYRMLHQYHRHPHAIGTSYSLSPNTATPAPAPDMENRIKSKPVTNDEPRFMLGMLNGLDKNWSFKKPGFFGTPTIMSNDPIIDNDEDDTNTNTNGAKDSLFCRLSKRQSLIMFSFCMADKKTETTTDDDKDKNSNSIRNEKHKPNLEQDKIQQEKSHRQIASENNNNKSNNNRNKKNKKGRWRISVAEYSSESHDNNKNANPTSPIRKDRVKKKGGGNTKGKTQKVTTQQNQQQQIEINETRPKVQVQVQNQGQQQQQQGQGQGQGQSGWGQQTTETSLPLGKQDINEWPDSEFSDSENNWDADPQDEMSMSMPGTGTMNMQMGTQDAEAKTEPPPMSSGSSNLQSRLPGKPKIILKSDASIQILYELSLEDLKKVQGDGQFHKKLENMRTENFEKLLQEHLKGTTDNNKNNENINPNSFSIQNGNINHNQNSDSNSEMLTFVNSKFPRNPNIQSQIILQSQR